MRVVISIITFCLLTNTSIVEAKNSLFDQNILKRNTLEREVSKNHPQEFLKVRIISILANPKKNDSGNTKILIENNHNFTILLKGWYLQTKNKVYYFQDEYIESNSIKGFTKIGAKNIDLKNSGDLINLYDQNSRLIHQLAYKNASEDLHLSLDKTTGLFKIPVTKKQIVNLETIDQNKIIKVPEIKKYNNKITTNEKNSFTLEKKISNNDKEIVSFALFPPFPPPLATYLILFLLIGTSLILIIKKDQIINA